MHTWTSFLIEFFDNIQDALSEVLNASGCREGWLQGEFFRYGAERDLRVNEYSLGGQKRADLYCPKEPRMIAEIKIIGADYQAKMRDALDEDVDRLKRVVDSGLEKYMILIIPESEVRSSGLGKHLNNARYSPECFEKSYPAFKVRIWRLGMDPA